MPSSDFFNSALATKITKKDSRVFPIFAQKQDADYSRVQVSDSKSFLGGLLEKGLSAFLRSQVCSALLVLSGSLNCLFLVFWKLEPWGSR